MSMTTFCARVAALAGACALALALATPVPAFAETILFGIIPVPDETDARLQVIERQPTEAWPFVPERGLLICVPLWPEPAVYFANEAERGEEALVAAIGYDPFLAFVTPKASRRLIREHADFMERARELEPFYWRGRRLCDQKKGTIIGPGEL